MNTTLTKRPRLISPVIRYWTSFTLWCRQFDPGYFSRHRGHHLHSFLLCHGWSARYTFAKTHFMTFLPLMRGYHCTPIWTNFSILFSDKSCFFNRCHVSSFSLLHEALHRYLHFSSLLHCYCYLFHITSYTNYSPQYHSFGNSMIQ